MNEYLGNNIRMLRKGKKLTQEQLADNLGVSFQAVSRWENCVTYPDVEIIPIIARFFGVSTDALFGIPEEKKKSELNNLIKGIGELGENDTERALQIIRTVRAGYDLKDTFGPLCYRFTGSRIKKTPAIIDELRRMAELFFESNPGAQEKSYALKNFIQLEDEEFVPALLDRYASDEDSTIDALLYERYLYRDDFDKLEIYRQRRIYKLINEMINGTMSWKDWRKPNDVNFAFWKNNIFLDFLHALNNETPTKEHPISCGFTPDIFIEQRVYLGELRTCYLATLGRTEEAFLTLEDTISLIEQAMNIQDGAILKSRCPVLPTLDFKVQSIKTTDHAKMYYSFDGDHSSEDVWGIMPEIDYKRLTTDRRWAWFDPIRNDTHFIELAERVKKLI